MWQTGAGTAGEGAESYLQVSTLHLNLLPTAPSACLQPFVPCKIEDYPWFSPWLHVLPCFISKQDIYKLLLASKSLAAALPERTDRAERREGPVGYVPEVQGACCPGIPPLPLTPVAFASLVPKCGSLLGPHL